MTLLPRKSSWGHCSRLGLRSPILESPTWSHPRHYPKPNSKLESWNIPTHSQLPTTINRWSIIEIRYTSYTIYLVPLAFLDLRIGVLAGTPPLSPWKSSFNQPTSRSEQSWCSKTSSELIPGNPLPNNMTIRRLSIYLRPSVCVYIYILKRLLKMFKPAYSIC